MFKRHGPPPIAYRVWFIMLLTLTQIANAYDTPLTISSTAYRHAPQSKPYAILDKGENRRSKRAALHAGATFWQNGRIPYSLAKAHEATQRAFLDAILKIHEKTTVRFVERTREHNYLDVITIRSLDTCGGSYVGQRGGAQPFEIAEDCQDQETVLHELMHALGFLHEYERPDRDDHIKALDSLREDETPTTNPFISTHRPFDYASITHHRDEIFYSLNPRYPINRGGGRGELSEEDSAAINEVYPYTTVPATHPTSATLTPRWIALTKGQQRYVTINLDCSAKVWHASPTGFSIVRSQPACHNNRYTFIIMATHTINEQQDLYFSILHPSGQRQQLILPIVPSPVSPLPSLVNRFPLATRAYLLQSRVDTTCLYAQQENSDGARYQKHYPVGTQPCQAQLAEQQWDYNAVKKEITNRKYPGFCLGKTDSHGRRVLNHQRSYVALQQCNQGDAQQKWTHTQRGMFLSDADKNLALMQANGTVVAEYRGGSESDHYLWNLEMIR